MGYGVSELGQLNYINSLLSSQRNDLNTLQDQISSGYKASLYSDLGGADSITSISLHSALSQIDTYGQNVSLVRGRTSVMDTALGSITSAAQSMSNQMLSVADTSVDPGMANFNVAAKAALGQIQSLLNSQYSGEYVFAGTDLSNAPLPSTAPLDSSVQTQLASLYSGAANGATVLSNISSITGTAAGYSASVGASGNLTAQIDTSQNVDYTVKANQPAFQGLIQGLSIMANLQYDPNHPSDFWTVFNGAKQLIDQGTAGVIDANSKVGLVQSQLDQVDASHATLQTALQTQLGDVEDVDVAKAATQLQLLQTQLEASYKVTSMVNDLSLVKYL